jgi:hypothetical protein
MKEIMFFILCMVLFSCEKSSIEGNEHVVLYKDWGTFMGIQPQDTVIFNWVWGGSQRYILGKDTIITDPYKELRVRYIAVNSGRDSMWVDAVLFLGSAVDTFTIPPLSTRSVFHIIRGEKLQNGGIGVMFYRYGIGSSGRLILHSLSVVGVRK